MSVPVNSCEFETDSRSSFYRPAAYALAQVVVDVPLVFIQVVLFDLIVYLLVIFHDIYLLS